MSGSVALEASTYSVREQDGSITVAFVRTGDLSGSAQVLYGINPSTATAADFTGSTGTVTFASGQARTEITIPIINDALSEATETFNVSIVDVLDATLLFPRTARVDILDDENPVLPPTEPPLISNFSATQQAVITTNLNQPMTFEWSPTSPNLMYIGEKVGTIKVFDTTTGALVSTFIDIRDQVNAVADRGLIDIALDPAFPTRPYIYAFYVVDPPESASLTGFAGRDGEGNRYAHVVRFEADPATNFTTLLPGSTPIILVGSAGDTINDISGLGAISSNSNFTIPSSEVDPVTGQFIQNYIKVDSTTHVGGSLEFGPDGALYVSIGDGASFDAVDPRAISVQDVNSLSGKILRINPDTGQGLADNPFVQPGQSLDLNASKVYQMGLRNPYALTFAPDGDLLISETGWYTWEEINSGTAGANFGWPYFEGGAGGVSVQAPGYNELPSAGVFYAAVQSGQISLAAPFVGLSHATGDPGFQFNAIIGADSVYTGNVYPTELQNSYFFTNIVAGTIFAVDVNDERNIQYLMTSQFGFGPVHFAQGPDGYMYYADLLTNQIGRFLIQPKLTNVATNGSAFFDPGTLTYTLTPDLQNQAGSVMSTRRIDLASDFDITFDVNVGIKELGSDGIAFVLHNDTRGSAAVGGAGGDFGVKGIADGLAIEFDTYNNFVGNELDDDHTNFFDTDTGATGATAAVSLGNIEDGTWHQVNVQWDVSTQTLTYGFDGVVRGTLTGDLALQYFGGSDFVYYGFGGGTGGSTNLQQIKDLTVNAVFEDGPPDQPPVVANPISDAAANAGALFNFTVPANTFSDPDPGDTLTLSARISGGTTLPAWLTFNPLNGQFSGTPTITDAGTYNIEVRATDLAGASVTDVFTLSVNTGGGGTLPTFVVNGDASFSATTGVHTLTPNAQEQVGTVMAASRVDLASSFTLSFDAFLGSSEAGADGIGFVLHNDLRGATAVGLGGGEFGIKGIANGIGIQFDTYNNFSPTDIAADHTSFFDTDLAATFETAAVALPNLEDGAFHDIVVRWNAATGVLSYDVDGVLRGSLTANLSTTYLGGSRYAYFGFGGGTGGATNLQQVKVTAFEGVLEGQNPVNQPPNSLTVTPITRPESALPGTVVATLAATDPNEGDSLTYSLSSNPGGLFTIIGNQVVLAPGAALDFETATSYAITVVVSDQGGLTRSQAATITVTNVNEAPTSIGVTGPQSVAENAANGTVVATISGIDPDAGDTLTFTLTDTAGGRFTLVGNSIVVANGTLLDFETANSHTVTVRATDSGGLFRSQSVVVAVTNVNEAAVFAASSVSTGTVTEDVAPLQAAGTLTVVDPDAGQSGVVARTNVAGTFGTFNINAAGNWTYALNNASAAVQALTATDVRTETFTVTSIDGTASRSVVITVRGADESGPLGVTIEGSAGNDIVTSSSTVPGQPLPTSLADTIRGNGGNDSLRGLAGNDTILGGTGNDTLVGGSGADSLDGGDGDDLVYIDSDDVAFVGGIGTDTLIIQGTIGAAGINLLSNGFERFTGNSGNDIVSGAGATTNLVLLGQGGNDTLAGGEANDSINGSTGNDSLVGGGGADTLVGGSGIDSLDGGSGDDTLYIDADDAAITGGAGFDAVIMQGSIGYNGLVMHANGLERFTGNFGNDVVSGSGASTIALNLNGNGGNDTLTGGGGADSLFGSSGNDSLSGGGGGDSLSGGSDNDTLNGGAGTDTLNGGSGNDTFVFDASALTGTVDSITDFSVPNDTVALTQAAFTALVGNASGILLASNFVIGAQAATADHRMIYNSANGGLFYDADGNGTGAAVRIATLQTGLAMTASDFLLL
jgi:VCBS repeat-containing protein